jgi:hypothetical protein
MLIDLEDSWLTGREGWRHLPPHPRRIIFTHRWQAIHPAGRNRGLRV